MKIVADVAYKGMFRIQYPNGTLSDMINYSRAKDIATDYQSNIGGEHRRKDRILLQSLLTALDASDRALRRDGCGDWAIFGKTGHIYADFARWHLAVYPGTSRRWTNTKCSMSAFTQLAVDCDVEGTFKLDRLPTQVEAIEIRDVLGIRKRREVTDEHKEKLVEALAKARAAKLEQRNEWK